MKTDFAFIADSCRASQALLIKVSLILLCHCPWNKSYFPLLMHRTGQEIYLSLFRFFSWHYSRSKCFQCRARQNIRIKLSSGCCSLNRTTLFISSTSVSSWLPDSKNRDIGSFVIRQVSQNLRKFPGVRIGISEDC